MDAFDSPNFELLGKIGISIEIHWVNELFILESLIEN
jgi:hypothetical protein